MSRPRILEPGVASEWASFSLTSVRSSNNVKNSILNLRSHGQCQLFAFETHFYK